VKNLTFPQRMFLMFQGILAYSIYTKVQSIWQFFIAIIVLTIVFFLLEFIFWGRKNI